MGNNASKLGNLPNGQLPWFTRIARNTAYHVYCTSDSAYDYVLQFENPLVTFGAQAGGTPLYINQNYRFGVSAGGQLPEIWSPGGANDLRIRVYRKSDFANGAMNVPPAYEQGIHLPQRGTPAWDVFAAQDFSWTINVSNSATLTFYDLKITLQYVHGAQAYERWGSGEESPLIITHRASSDQYFYRVDTIGYGDFSGRPAWLAADDPSNPDETPDYALGYTLDFEEMPPWRSTFIQAPQFDGQPLPSTYEGKSVDELLNVTSPVNSTPSLAPSACLTLDQSPELRRHPILDRFVADLANDPIALANYVHNEVRFTDGIRYSDNGNVTEKSINLGGVNRGALATFQEGQGSPWEQCALLVYLLRQAGVPAVYLEPEHDKLPMLDVRMSRLLRMQIKGAVDYLGRPYDPANPGQPNLIPVNYPWVAAWIQSQNRWVHLFPWIKDTEIIEKLELYSLLPEGFNSGLKWARKYLAGDATIIPSGATDDTLRVLFPQYVKNTLEALNPEFCIDDIGVRIRDRPNYRSTWNDFPTPFNLQGNPTTVESLKEKPGIFDAISVEVFSNNNPSRKVVTGELRMVDFHNRKFVLRHEKTGPNLHNMILSLAAFRPGLPGLGSFGTSDPDLLKEQVSTQALDSSDDYLTVRTVYRRHRALPSGFVADTWPYLGINEMTLISKDRPLRKGDLSAFCFNVGRVSQRMLAVHAEEFWQMERTLQVNPDTPIDPDISQGTSAYLMGMSYYERLSRFGEECGGLHKISTVSFYAFGQSRLTPKRVGGVLPNNGDLEMRLPSVDMSFMIAAFAGNGTLHPDSGSLYTPSTANFYNLFITGGSAEEHQIINSYYKDATAISTAKLLQRARTDYGGYINLTKANYVSEGDKSYVSGGVARKLKDWDLDMWNSVTGTFTAVSGDDALVYITPGPVESQTGDYRGLGAMIYARDSWAALISANNGPLNGGFGGSFSVPIYTQPELAFMILEQRADGGYQLNHNRASVSAPAPAPSVPAPANLSIIATNASANAYVYTAFQSDWTEANSTNRGVPNTFAAVVTATVDGGALHAAKARPGVPWWRRGSTYVKNGLERVFDPVNVVTGEFYVDAVDLRLNGPMPLEIRRNYLSQNLSANEFGYGWKMNVEPYLTFNSDESLIYAADLEGSVIAYRRQLDPNLWIPIVDDNPRFSNVNQDLIGSVGNCLNAKVVKSISGADTIYTLSGSDGSRRVFRVQSFPTGGINRTRPYLDAWEDANGNFWKCVYGADANAVDYGKLRRVEASNGTFVGFYYDTFGHITEAYTGDGRRVYYEYDASGDLTHVTRPDASEFSFEYETETTMVNGKAEVSSKHLLIREIKPEGRLLENTHDADRRVTQQKATVGPDMIPVVNATFDYSVDGQTTVRDAYNRPTVYQYTSGLITASTDALGQVETTDWYLPGDVSPGAYNNSIHRKTDQRGLVTEFKYDARGNVIETRVTGDLNGDGAVETATNTTFYNDRNLPTETDDSLGNRTLLSYDDPNYPYLPTTIEKKAADGTSISRTVRTYGATGAAQPFARGLLLNEKRAAGTPDEAVTAWTYDPHGFPASRMNFTGTSDPNVWLAFVCNLRGEVVQRWDADNRTAYFGYDALGRRIWIEWADEAGNLLGWDCTYYNANGEVEWNDGPRYNPEDYVWHSYDGAGRPKEEIRWRSQAKTDGTGVEAPIGDDLYATTFYSHDLFGNLLEIRDARHNSTVMEYDAIGQMTSRKSYEGTPAGTLLRSESFAYEPGGNVSVYTNPLGGLTRKFYATSGLLRRQENPDGSIQEWRYDLLGRVVKETLSNSSYWETTYNDAQRTITRTFKNASDQTLATQAQSFDRRGNVTSRTDAEGYTFTTAYDGLDRVKTRTGPAATASSAQQATTYTYDASGRVLRVSNGLGETTLTTTDAMGRPVLVATLASHGTIVAQTAYSYASNHHSVTVTSGTGVNAISSTSYSDTYGKTVLTLYATGDKHMLTYDALGNLLTSTDEMGRTTCYAYDGLNRTTTETLPDGAATGFSYDTAGNLLERRMPAGLTWRATYDRASRQLTEKLAHLDASGNEDAVSRRYAYDYYATGPIGLLKSVADPRGIVHTTTYDDFLRVQTVAAPSATAPGLTVSYAYDLRGFPTQIDQSYQNSAQGPPTSVLRTFDGYGQVTSESVSSNSVAVRAFSQAWDATGRRSSLHSPNASLPSPTFGFAHRADGLLATVTANGQNYQFSYADNGLLTGSSNPWVTRTLAQRDARGRIQQQTSAVAGNLALAETTVWQADSKLDSYTVARRAVGGGNTPAVPDETRAYGYNNRGQLVSQSYVPPGGSAATVTYAFDAGQLGIREQALVNGGTTGNFYYRATEVSSLARLTKEVTNGRKRSFTATGNALGAQSVDVSLDGQPAGPVTYAGYPGNGDWSVPLESFMGQHTLQATAHHPSGQFHPSTSSTFTVQESPVILSTGYDDDGNTTSRSFSDGISQSLTWDAAGRLVRVIQRNSANDGYDWQALYDGLARRWQTQWQKIAGNNATGSPVVVDSWFDPGVEFLEVGVAVAGQISWKVYGADLNGVYGGLQGIGGLQSVVSDNGAVAKSLLQDFFGNGVACATDGQVTWNNARVDGYGPLPGLQSAPLDTSTSEPALTCAWRGKRIDPTGFYWLGARYYEPQLGRFLSADPFGHASSFNLYEYSDGDPVNGTDPDGRCGKQQFSGLAAWAQGKYSDAGTTLSSLWDRNTRADAFKNFSFGESRGLLNWSYETASEVNHLMKLQNPFLGFNEALLNRLYGFSGTTLSQVETRLQANPSSSEYRTGHFLSQSIANVFSFVVGAEEGQATKTLVNALPQMAERDLMLASSGSVLRSGRGLLAPAKEAVLMRLKSILRKHDADLIRDTGLLKKGSAGEYCPYLRTDSGERTGIATIILRDNPTTHQVLHEVKHWAVDRRGLRKAMSPEDREYDVYKYFLRRVKRGSASPEDELIELNNLMEHRLNAAGR